MLDPPLFHSLKKHAANLIVIFLRCTLQKISMLLLDSGADKSVVTESVKNRITCPDCKRVVKQYSL